MSEPTYMPDEWIVSVYALIRASQALRAQWPEGGCLVVPACGRCAWCDFDRAVTALTITEPRKVPS